MGGGGGGKSVFTASGLLDKDWPPRPYMVKKTLKNLLLRNQRANDPWAWDAALGT